MKWSKYTYAAIGLATSLSLALYRHGQYTGSAARAEPEARNAPAANAAPATRRLRSNQPNLMENPRFQALALRGINDPYLQALYPYALNHELSPVERDFYSLTRVHDFIGKYLPAAQKGDPGAQYFLGQAVLLCMNWKESRDYIKARLAERTARNEPNQGWRRQYLQEGLTVEENRCDGMDDDFGRIAKNALAWTSKAAAGGDPQAQLWWAGTILESVQLGDLQGEKPDALRQKAREYLLKAVDSGHPLVLSSVAYRLMPRPDQDLDANAGSDPIEALAWAQLAADRGARDPRDSWRDRNEYRFSAAQQEAAAQRARVLTQLLMQGDMDALRTPILFQGFGLPEFGQPLLGEGNAALQTLQNRLASEAGPGYAD